MKKPFIIATIAVVGGVSGAMLASSLMKKVDRDVVVDTGTSAGTTVSEEAVSEPVLVPDDTFAGMDTESGPVSPVTTDMNETVEEDIESGQEQSDDTVTGAGSMVTSGPASPNVEEIPFNIPDTPVSARVQNAVNSPGIAIPSLDRNYGDGRPLRPHAMQDYYGVDNPQPIQPVDEGKAYESRRNRLGESIRKLRQ